MADFSLDDMLLEAAGRPKGGDGGGRSHGPPTKRRRASSMSSDDGSDSSPDNDDEDDEEFDDRGGRSGKQAKGSKMPLKKRFEKDGDDGARDDGYNSEFSYGSDLYRDEEDRHNLAQMTELEREMELADRSEKRDTWLALRKSRGNRQAEFSTPNHRRERDLGPPSSRMRSSVREGTRSKKENALNELVARRQKAQDPSSLRKRGRDSGMTPSREAHSPGRKKPSQSMSFSESDPPSEDDGDSERDDDRSDVGGSGDELEDKGEPEATEDEIKDIVIRRSKLAKWFMEPFFEEIIVGCFVRIGIGVSSSGQSIYRVCQVKNVDAKDPDKQYKFENFMTYKYLNCFWGDESTAARWQMVRASDQPASQKEISDYLRAVDNAKGRRPLKVDVLEKKAAISKVNQFVYSASTVKQMLQEKKMAASRPANVALEKDRLIKELGIAESKGEHAEVEKLQSRLKELELFANQVKSKDAKAMALAEMNRRNKMENFKNASMLKPVNTFAKEGDAGYDPFSRRWTRSQNYYQSQPKTEEKETVEGSNAEDGAEKAGIKASEQSEIAKHVESQAAADRRKLYALHNFVLPISLSKLGNTKGPGGVHQAFVQAYMARKAHLEASCGVQVSGLGLLYSCY